MKTQKSWERIGLKGVDVFLKHTPELGQPPQLDVELGDLHDTMGILEGSTGCGFCVYSTQVQRVYL